MKTTRMILIGLMLVAAMTTTAIAQEEAAAEPKQTTAAATSTAAEERPVYENSLETRKAFLEALGKYPPQVSKVLKLDPALFSNASYLANYPELAEFAARHPEVAHTPAFFLESVWLPGDLPARTASERIWEQTMEGLATFAVMLLVVGTLAWLIRTLIEHRRWSRLSRTQVEVHGKLMDRLQSNEELIAYMQTPAGKRFLESAPIPLDASPRAVSAPIGRILWSMQVGLVLVMGGFGLQFVSRTVDRDASQPLLAMGILGTAIGFGFLLSAFVSFVMSKRLGLIGQPEAPSPVE
ncbi:MAG TPA: hypothetical protein VFV49_05575 [Thermoanaerobaculia bacterium]|nr:hypothetical protein [Thermoanaerobaculia bacterium]